MARAETLFDSPAEAQPNEKSLNEGLLGKTPAGAVERSAVLTLRKAANTDIFNATKVDNQQLGGPGMDPSDETRNVAIAHFSTGISRPLNYGELSEIVDGMVEGKTSMSDLPFCIQGYIAPVQNRRYIATYGHNQEGATCVVFARRSNAHVSSDAPQASASTGGEHREAATSEEDAVERQLVGLGLLEPISEGIANGGEQREAATSEEEAVERQLFGLGLLQPISEGIANGTEPVLYVPRKIKLEIQRILQLVAAFVEDVHGYRMQGMVSEFLHAADGAMFLTSVLAVQWDTSFQATAPSPKSLVAKFSDQWGSFTSGIGGVAGPTASSANRAPTRRGPMLKRCGGAGGGAGEGAGAGEVAGGGAGAGSPKKGTAIEAAARKPPPVVPFSKIRDSYELSSKGPNSSGYTARNARSTLRKGAGGNPTTTPPASSSFTLWHPQEMAASESVVGSLALELVAVKEALQRQTDTEMAASESVVGSMALELEAVKEALQRQTDIAIRADRWGCLRSLLLFHGFSLEGLIEALSETDTCQ
eukprot:gene23589-9117_t